MSRKSGLGFKNLSKYQPIEISNKISNNKLRKQQLHMNKQQNNKTGITKIEFESIMSENKLNNKLDNKQKKIIYNVPESDKITNFVNELLDKKIVGQELVNYIDLNCDNSNCNNSNSNNFNCNNLNGVDFLNGLLNINQQKNTLGSVVTLNTLDVSWIENNNLGLKKLFEKNIHEQIIGLIMIQNYCEKNNFMKIQYKNKLVYLIRILFHLFFIFEIFEEEAYWGWQEYIENTNKIDESTKKILLIQTTDFFMILKTTFNDEDYENNEKNLNNENNFNNKKKHDYDNKNDYDDHDDIDDEIDDENKFDKTFDVPEEQDYNLDDI